MRCPPDVTGSNMRGITEPRGRAPEPIMKDGFVHYHIQCVEDDRPVGPEVAEVELVPPGHPISHTNWKAS